MDRFVGFVMRNTFLKKFLVFLTFALVLSLAALSGLQAGSGKNPYRAVEVPNGGTLKGTAVLSGQIPEDRMYHLVLFPNSDLCDNVDTDENNNRVIKNFEVGPDGALKDVVIAIQGVQKGKPFGNRVTRIKAENCEFIPPVVAVRQGSQLVVDNEDDVVHNSQVYQSERGKIILNIPIPPKKVARGVIHFQKDYRIFQMICGMHEFMQTWGFRVDNPYYAISDENGRYAIRDVPPGDYEVTAWHSQTPILTQTVHIPANGEARLDFEFDGNKIVRPIYETIHSGRIKKDAFKSRSEILSH